MGETNVQSLGTMLAGTTLSGPAAPKASPPQEVRPCSVVLIPPCCGPRLEAGRPAPSASASTPQQRPQQPRLPPTPPARVGLRRPLFLQLSRLHLRFDLF